MIQLSYLDYSAVEGKSWLHRRSPMTEIIGMVLVLLGLISLRSLPVLGLLYMTLLALFFISRIPLKIFSLTLYPLLFTVFFIFISKNLGFGEMGLNFKTPFRWWPPVESPSHFAGLFSLPLSSIKATCFIKS